MNRKENKDTFYASKFALVLATMTFTVLEWFQDYCAVVTHRRQLNDMTSAPAVTRAPASVKRVNAVRVRSPRYICLFTAKMVVSGDVRSVFAERRARPNS